MGGPAPYWTDYSIDPKTGNRTSTIEHPTSGTATTGTYSYPAAGAARPHAVQTVSHTGGTSGTSSYGYAADGGTTTRPGQTLTYDAEGRVSTVTAGSTTQGDVYDASGNLLLQTDSTTGSTLFLGATQLHETKGSTTASAVRTYSINGTPIAERSTTVGVSGSVLTWLGTDAQGTVNLQVSASTGTATARYQDPFGQARGTSSTTWSDGHGFLNATTDALSGLVQLGARMYDASIGRFLSVDPVLKPSDPQQNNGYSYAHNTPVDLADPNGLDPAEYWNPNTAPGTPYAPPGTSPRAPGNTASLSHNVEIVSTDPNRAVLAHYYRLSVLGSRLSPGTLNNPYNQLLAWRGLCAASVISPSCNQAFRDLLANSMNGVQVTVAAELAAGGEIRIAGTRVSIVGSAEWSQIQEILANPSPGNHAVVAFDAPRDLPSEFAGKSINYEEYSLSTASGLSSTQRVALGSDGSAYFSTDNFARPEQIFPINSAKSISSFSPGGLASPFGFDAESGDPDSLDWGSSRG